MTQLFDMDQEDWNDFFDLLDNITNLRGTWQEKRGIVRHEAEKRDAGGALEEFTGWFDRSED